MSPGGADFEASTEQLRQLAEEVRDRASLMIAVGLGTSEHDALYAEARAVLNDIERAERERQAAERAPRQLSRGLTEALVSGDWEGFARCDRTRPMAA